MTVPKPKTVLKGQVVEQKPIQHSPPRTVRRRQENLYKRTCKTAEGHTRQQFFEKLLDADDPKGFWKMITDMRGWGREIVDPCDTIPPQDWEEHFKNLLNTKEANKLMNRKPSKMEELDTVIAKSKLGKARRPDGTSNMLQTMVRRLFSIL